MTRARKKSRHKRDSNPGSSALEAVVRRRTTMTMMIMMMMIVMNAIIILTHVTQFDSSRHPYSAVQSCDASKAHIHAHTWTSYSYVRTDHLYTCTYTQTDVHMHIQTHTRISINSWAGVSCTWVLLLVVDSNVVNKHLHTKLLTDLAIYSRSQLYEKSITCVSIFSIDLMKFTVLPQPVAL